MRALMLTAYNQLEIRESPDPTIGPDDVLVRVEVCGICGSDVHGLDGSTGRRVPPIIMGHEAAGVVAAVGANVGDLEPGRRVTFDSMISCGHCAPCRLGRSNLCEHRQVLGVSCTEFRRDGAFAELVAVPREIVYPLPDGVSAAQAAMCEPLSVAVHAAGRLPIRLGDAAVVVGAGVIGLLAIQVLRAAGCGRIVAVDLDQSRLRLALRLGADAAVDAGRSTDAQADIRRHTGPRGAELVVDAVGTAASLATALGALAKGGHAALIGNVQPSVALPLQAVVTGEMTLHGCCASAGEYPACLEMLALRRIDVDSLISARAPLEEGPRWFERLRRGEPGLIKVLLEP